MNYYNDLITRARKVGLGDLLPFDDLTVHTQLVDGKAHYPGVRHRGTLDQGEPAVSLTLVQAAEVETCEHCRIAFSPTAEATALGVIVEATEVIAKAERYLAKPTRRPVADVVRDLRKQLSNLEMQQRRNISLMTATLTAVMERCSTVQTALGALPVSAQVLERAVAKTHDNEAGVYGAHYTHDTTPMLIGISGASRTGGDLGALLRALSGHHTLPEVLLLVVPAWVATHIVRTSGYPVRCHNAAAIDPQLADMPSLLDPDTVRPHPPESLLADAERLWARHHYDPDHPLGDPVNVIASLIASTT